MSEDPCPSPEDLQLLLEEKVDATHERWLVGHLERCSLCQEGLDRLMRRREWGIGLKDLSTERGSGFGDRAGGQETPQTPPPVDATTERRAKDQSQTTETTPGPTGQPVATTGPSMPAIPGYELLEKLGEGGMGVVYRARQIGLNRLVAVKMIRGGSQARPEHFSRFRIEAEAVARLRHAHIIQIHDIGAVEGLPFVSLELLEGGSLDERLKGTPQPAKATATLMGTLARAVQVAHDAGIIHRDLKPSNVLYTSDGVPKITDFGLAKRLESDSRQTESGAIMGSPSYMAPEQARGHTKDVGPAADVYALGAILYEMLTGRPPFKGETPLETVRQVVDDEVVPPSRLVPKVARDLETISLKCLNKEPAKRYPTAGALDDELDRFLRGEPILGRRAGPIERGYRWVRRRPAAAALIVVGLSTAIGLPTWWGFQEHALRVQQEAKERRAQGFVRDGGRLLDAERKAVAADELSGVRSELTQLLGRLDDESDPRIEDLLDQIKSAIDDADLRLGTIKARAEVQRRALEKEKTDLAEQQRFQSFVAERTRAELEAAGLELGLEPSQGGSPSSIRDALSLYAVDPAASLEHWERIVSLPAVLSPDQQRRVDEGCYALLLVAARSAEPARGLRILDRAARLRTTATAAYHLRRADCLRRGGDLKGQADELEKARKCTPTTALDHFLLGREQATARNWADAISLLETAVRLDPDQAAPKLLVAICQFNVQPQRLGEALTSLNDCIGSHPELPGLYILRAVVHGERGAQSLAQAGTSPSEAASLRRQASASFQAAEADYAAAQKLPLTDDVRYVLHVNRAGMLLNAERHNEARAELEAAIAAKPEPFQAHATLGQLNRRLGRLDDAFQALARAIDRAPDDPTRVLLHRARGALRADRSDLNPAQRSAALADLDAAIRLQPKDSPEKAADHAERARLLFGADRYDEALEACDRALAIVPGHPLALRLRISSLLALKQYDRVLGFCDAYLASQLPSLEVLEIRGLARITIQDYAGAIGDYTQALRLQPELDLTTKTRLLNRRGWAYHFADAPRLARADFEASCRIDPERPEALSGRGLARIRLGDWRPALADAEQSLQLEKASPGKADAHRQALFNAARIYAQAVEFAAAEVSREGERAVSLYRAYRTRALDLLQQALKEVPVSDRAQFLSDPMLKPLRLERRLSSTHQIIH
jgi:tetratricopeptide (TPR) repeat protein